MDKLFMKKLIQMCRRINELQSAYSEIEKLKNQVKCKYDWDNKKKQSLSPKIKSPFKRGWKDLNDTLQK